MSAWIVTRKHVEYLVNAAATIDSRGDFYWYHDKNGRKLPYGDYDAATRIAQILWDENHKSVNYRYRESEKSPEYGDHEFKHQKLDLAQLFKAIDCYQYQTCEHPEWEASEAKKFTDTLRKIATTRVPGYEDAKWGID